MKGFVWFVTAAAALASGDPTDAHAETKSTKLALNWESRPKAANQTENASAKLPGDSFVLWWRDVESVSTDTFVLGNQNGSMCIGTVRSSDPIVLECGRTDDYLKLTRLIGESIEVRRLEEVAPPPQQQSPPPKRTPRPAPSKQPDSPAYAPAKSRVRS
jgi:hypothetical protein